MGTVQGRKRERGRGRDGDIQETDGEAEYEHPLVAVGDPSEDAEHGQRDGLHLVEVRRVEERPGVAVVRKGSRHGLGEAHHRG